MTYEAVLRPSQFNLEPHSDRDMSRTAHNGTSSTHHETQTRLHAVRARVDHILKDKKSRQTLTEFGKNIAHEAALFSAGYVTKDAIRHGTLAAGTAVLPLTALGLAAVDTALDTYRDHHRLYKKKQRTTSDGTVYHEKVLRRNAARNLYYYYTQEHHQTTQVSSWLGKAWRNFTHASHVLRHGLTTEMYKRAVGAYTYREWITQQESFFTEDGIKKGKQYIADKIAAGDTEAIKAYETQLKDFAKHASYGFQVAITAEDKTKALAVTKQYYELLEETSQHTGSKIKEIIKEVRSQRTDTLTQNVIKGNHFAVISRATGALLRVATGAFVVDAIQAIRPPVAHAGEATSPQSSFISNHTSTAEYYQSQPTISNEYQPQPTSSISEIISATEEIVNTNTVTSTAAEVVRSVTTTKEIPVRLDLFHTIKDTGFNLEQKGNAKPFLDMVLPYFVQKGQIDAATARKLYSIANQNPHMNIYQVYKIFGRKEFDHIFMVHPGSITITEQTTIAETISTETPKLYTIENGKPTLPLNTLYNFKPTDGQTPLFNFTPENTQSAIYSQNFDQTPGNNQITYTIDTEHNRVYIATHAAYSKDYGPMPGELNARAPLQGDHTSIRLGFAQVRDNLAQLTENQHPHTAPINDQLVNFTLKQAEVMTLDEHGAPGFIHRIEDLVQFDNSITYIFCGFSHTQALEIFNVLANHNQLPEELIDGPLAVLNNPKARGAEYETAVNQLTEWLKTNKPDVYAEFEQLYNLLDADKKLRKSNMSNLRFVITFQAQGAQR